MSNPIREGAAAAIPAKATGLLRIWRAGGYSWQGIRGAFVHEAAFRQEVLLALVLVPLAVVLPFALVVKAYLIGSMLFVLVVELLNSAVESLVDLVCEGFHPKAGLAKDLGSAAVLLSLVQLAVAWGFSLWQIYGS